MKKITLILLILSLFGCSTVQSLTATPLEKAQYEEEFSRINKEIDAAVVAALQDFTIESSSLLLDDKNHVYSPLSFYLAMSMVLPMSENETKAQLEEFLHNQVVDLTMLETLQFNNEVGTLQLANSLWLQEDRDINMELMSSISKDYYASIYPVNFKNKDATSKKMNDWINDMTNNFIKEVDVDISNDTVISLINTIYLKDSWSYPFQKEKTMDMSFILGDGNSITVPFMSEEYGELAYLKSDEFQLVSKPLANGSQVHLVLPNGDLESLLNAETLETIVKHESNTAYVDLNLPKFDLDGDYSLIELSQSMGLTLPFDSQASEIFPYNDRTSVLITAIKQQARMAVDENGVEAAAYTQVSFTDTAAPDYEHVSITFDKPFLVLITSPQNIPLFISTVADPRGE